MIICDAGGVGLRPVWTTTVFLVVLRFFRSLGMYVYVPVSTRGLGVITVCVCCVVGFGGLETGGAVVLYVCDCKLLRVYEMIVRNEI